MPQITKRLPKISSLSGGTTVTIDCPLGRVYHHIVLEFAPNTAAALAAMTGIRVIVNGTAVQRYTSGTQLNTMNMFVGRADAVTQGRLFIDFDQHDVRIRPDEWLTALMTGSGYRDDATGQADPRPVESLQIEIDIADPQILTALRAKALQNTTGKINAVIRHVRQFNSDIAAGVGRHDIDKLPLGSLFKRVGLDFTNRGGTAALDTALVLVDDFVLFERNVADNEAEQTDGWRTPQAGWYFIDPTEAGYGGEGFITRDPDAGGRVDDWRIQILKAAGATAGSLPVVLESHDIVPV